MMTSKILVVDDEPSISNLVVSYLRKEGYEVYSAVDGPGGLQAARVYHPDLIILDIMLPGMDGLELLTQLRRESNVYVILLTAKTDELDRVLGLSIGTDDYVFVAVHVGISGRVADEDISVTGNVHISRFVAEEGVVGAGHVGIAHLIAQKHVTGTDIGIALVAQIAEACLISDKYVVISATVGNPCFIAYKDVVAAA